MKYEPTFPPLESSRHVGPASPPANLKWAVLRISLFGGARLEYDGEPHAFRASLPAIALLGYLVLHRGVRLQRSFVAFSMWPDEPQTAAFAHLRRALFTLNEALPRSHDERWILADKRTLQWNPTVQIWIDVAEFERLSTDLGTQAAALELYAGPVLPDVHDEWLAATRDRLNAVYLDTLSSLVERLSLDGEGRVALRFAQRLLLADPFREDTVRTAMRLRARLGDRAGALQVYREFEERLTRELGVDPDVQTRELFEGIASEPAAPRARPPNLPKENTAFVGRESDVAGIKRILDGGARLVTILGPGGIGKSRLALETARAVLRNFEDGAWLVQLAQLSDPRLVLDEVARIFGAEGTNVDEVKQCLIRILETKRAIVVLDNCEHLSAQIACVLKELLAACNDVCVLATSRERLRIDAEWTYSLGPLQAPDAIELFVRRAGAFTSGRFELTPQNRDAIAEIARRTEGIPLAIELAVPWLRVLDAGQLAARLQDRFGVLVSDSRSTPARHRRLAAVIEWSYDLLSETEREVFKRLAVFPGTFTFEAAASLDAETSEIDLMAHIAVLIDKSLVMSAGSQERRRFLLLDTIREFAATEEGGSASDDLRMRHAKYYLDVADELHDARRRLPAEDLFARYVDDSHNFYAALSWCLEHRGDPAIGARLAVLLADFFAHGSFETARHWYELALDRVDPSAMELRADIELELEVFSRFTPYTEQRLARIRAFVEIYRKRRNPKLRYALGWMANALSKMGRAAEARRAAEESVAIARRLGIPSGLAWALRVYALVLTPADRAERVSALQQSLQVLGSSAPDVDTATALSFMSVAEFEGGDVDAARSFAREALEIYHRNPGMHQRLHATAMANLAGYDLLAGDIESGHALALDALMLAFRIGSAAHLISAIDCLALAAVLTGDAGEAARLVGFSDARLPDASPRNQPEQAVYERAMLLLEQRYSRDEIATLKAIGASWDDQTAVKEARQARAAELAARSRDGS
jgi:predicted ATPase/DNA-binding SARP family transcriptional activator